jgi:hypothetical protein
MNAREAAISIRRFRLPWRARVAESERCCVAGCQDDPLILVARTESRRILMCTPHAQQWVASGACRQSSFQDTATSLATLTSWAATAHSH